jgi:hypothetical protein
LYSSGKDDVMEYSSRFSQEVRRGLEGLKAAIDKDLGELDGIVPNLSFSQADEILSATSALINSYQTVMRPLYRTAGKPSYGSRRPSSSAGPRGKIEPAALETMREQGYLVDKDFILKYGFNRNAVSRKLQDMAQAYNWRRDRTAEGWRYAPLSQTPPAEAALPAGELASGPGVPAVDAPAQAPATETPTAAESTQPPEMGPRRRRERNPSRVDGSEVDTHE